MIATGMVRPGQRYIETEDGMLWFDAPDVVRLPRDLGGELRRVVAIERMSCPCGTGQPHQSRLLVLDDTRCIGVLECNAQERWLFVRLPHRDEASHATGA